MCTGARLADRLDAIASVIVSVRPHQLLYVCEQRSMHGLDYCHKSLTVSGCGEAESTRLSSVAVSVSAAEIIVVAVALRPV